MAGGAAARGHGAGLPHVVWVLAAGSLVNSSASFVVPFLVLYLVHRGYSASLAAGAVSAYAAGKIAACRPAGCLPTGPAAGRPLWGRWLGQPWPRWRWPWWAGRF